MENGRSKKGLFQKFLDFVEWLGNKLPHPVTLFAILAGLTLIGSWIFSALDVSVEHPGEEGTVAVTNLLSAEGINYIFLNMTDNFINFAPLGVVLVTMLGIGVAEHSGLISAALRGFVLSIPKSLITAGLVFAGIMSSLASDAGYVVLPPLGAVIYLALGRHPLAGLAAAFAGVSAGFSANLFLSGTDAMLAELSIAAAETIDPAYAETMNVTMNWFFIAASVFVLTLVGWFVSDKIVEPRLGKYNPADAPEDGGDDEAEDYMAPLSKVEKKGLWASFISVVIEIGIASFSEIAYEYHV